jgi:hypothetical protein
MPEPPLALSPLEIPPQAATAPARATARIAAAASRAPRRRRSFRIKVVVMGRLLPFSIDFVDNWRAAA